MPEWGFVLKHDHVVLQILRKKYDMGYLQPSWLGRKWQPWYQDLLDLAGIKGMLDLAFTQLLLRLLSALKVETCFLFNLVVAHNVKPKRHVLLRRDARLNCVNVSTLCAWSPCAWSEVEITCRYV